MVYMKSQNSYYKIHQNLKFLAETKCWRKRKEEKEAEAEKLILVWSRIPPTDPHQLSSDFHAEQLA